MNQPRTSIIIPSYRGEAKLPTLLNALSQQSDTDFEAVVVIDGLLDNSLEIIDSFASKVPVRAVVLEQNQGRVAALNAGFSAAKGQVLVRCDDDLEPGADFVSGHWARHQGQPCGVVGLTIDILPPSKYTRVYGATRTRSPSRLLPGRYPGLASLGC